MGGTVQINSDGGTWSHGYSNLDGSSYLKADVQHGAQLPGHFTLFFAVYPEQLGDIIGFYDILAQASFTVDIYNSVNSLRIRVSVNKLLQ